MASPTVSASLDKATYAPGEQMTLTVTYGDPDNRPVTVNVTVTDSENNTVLQAETAAVVDPLTVTVTDSDGRTWVKVSDNGSVAVYRATA